MNVARQPASCPASFLEIVRACREVRDAVHVRSCWETRWPAPARETRWLALTRHISEKPVARDRYWKENLPIGAAVTFLACTSTYLIVFFIKKKNKKTLVIATMTRSVFGIPKETLEIVFFYLEERVISCSLFVFFFYPCMRVRMGNKTMSQVDM